MFITGADGRKSGSTTVEQLAVILQGLSNHGIDLAATHVNIQLDNTGSQNKNNIVLAWLGVMVLAGIVRSCSANFLRTGHTHEDIDQLFSMLARFLTRQTCLETLDDFEGPSGHGLA